MAWRNDLSYISDQLQPLAVEVSELREDDRNANQHDDNSINKIAASLRAHGQRVPIWVQERPDTGERIVRAGNGRFRAAQLNGWSHIAATIEVCTDDDAIRFAISDNATAKYSDWDADQLQELLDEIGDSFDDEQLNEMVSDLTDWIDDADEPTPAFEPADASSQGQLDTIAPKMTTCPHCNKQFDIRKQ